MQGRGRPCSEPGPPKYMKLFVELSYSFHVVLLGAHSFHVIEFLKMIRFCILEMVENEEINVNT